MISFQTHNLKIRQLTEYRNFGADGQLVTLKNIIQLLTLKPWQISGEAIPINSGDCAVIITYMIYKLYDITYI